MKAALPTVIVCSLSFVFGYYVNYSNSGAARLVGVENTQALELQLASIVKAKGIIKERLEALQIQPDSQPVVPTTTDSPASRESAETKMLTKFLRDTYVPFFEKIYLSEEDQEEFCSILLESSKAISALFFEAMANSDNDEITDEVRDMLLQKRKELEAQADEQVQNLIGEDNYQTYEDYKKSLLVRQELSRVSSSLTEPLDAFTREEVARIMLEESIAANMPDLSQTMSQAEATKDYRDRSEAMEKRDPKVLARTSNYLTNEQQLEFAAALDKIRSLTKVQVEMIELQAKQRERQ